jgi:serine/threonine protein kinase/tetratricopeptide (TPR) repeat protein
MEKLELAKRYKILKKIGSGGGGEVYAVYDSCRDMKLALKIHTPAESAAMDEETFFGEYLLALNMSGPGLVRAYDYGYDARNFPFYTMELLARENIDQVAPQWDIRAILQASRQTATAIAFLHFFNLIHNDLKPENIKPVYGPEGDMIKLLDFGLTFDFSPDAPISRLSGTVEYMAPELFGSKNPDHRSDLYSLGVVFYKLISGELPYSNPDPLMVISDKLEKPYPALDKDCGSFPREYLELTHSLLSRDPEKRPQTAYEVAQSIGAMLPVGDYHPDFKDLLKSAAALTLSRKFEKNKYWQDTNRVFLFHDLVVMNHFGRLLRARLQKDYYNVTTETAGTRDRGDETVSPGSNKNASLAYHYLKAGEHFEPDQASEDSHFDLLLAPRMGGYSVAGKYQEQNLNLFSEVENWFSTDSATPEFFDKLEELCSEDIITLSVMLDELQENQVIRFDGRQWQADIEGFIEYTPSLSLQNSARENIAYLSDTERESLRMLAILKHGFDRNFILKFLEKSDFIPERLLRKFIADNILAENGGNCFFTSPLLRVALVNENSAEKLKNYHLKAATIFENTSAIDPVQKILSLARDYTLAEKPDDSVKWTLKAVELLVGMSKYRLALKLIANSLELVRKFPDNLDLSYSLAVLMAARGDLENKLGLINLSLSTFVGIIRMKRSVKDQHIIARAYKHLGDIYKANRDYKRGLRALQKALRINKRLDDKAEISHTYNNIGNIHWVGLEHDLALENYFAALKIQEEMNLLKDIAITLSNIGGCYYYKHEYDKSIAYIKRSIEIKKQINDRPELARSYNNLGAIYHSLGEISESLKYLYDSLKINREIDSKLEVLYNIDNIASCEITLGNYQQARALLKEQQELADRLSNNRFRASAMLFRGIIKAQMCEYGSAESTLHEGLEMFTYESDPEMKHLAHLHLAGLYYDLNQAKLFWERIEQAYTISEESGDKSGMISALLLKSRGFLKFLDDSQVSGQIVAQCSRLIAEINFNSPLCNLYLTELRLWEDQAEFPSAKLEELKKLLSQPSNQVLKARFHYYLAKRLIAQNRSEQARESLQKAALTAEKYSQFNLLWRVKYLQGTLENTLLNYEEAYINYKKAVGIIKELARKIGNQEYLTSFLQHPKAMQLKHKIVELASRMGQR